MIGWTATATAATCPTAISKIVLEMCLGNVTWKCDVEMSRENVA